MFVLDSLVRLPMGGIYTIARRIQEAVDGEAAGEAARIREQLRDMYMQLDSGRMAEAEFAPIEKQLLDRLDELESHGMDLADGGESNDQ